MYEETQLRKSEEWTFLANIHGIETDKDKQKQSENNEINTDTTIPQFDDPAKYANLPMEERERLTEEMLLQHKKWAKQK